MTSQTDFMGDSPIVFDGVVGERTARMVNTCHQLALACFAAAPALAEIAVCGEVIRNENSEDGKFRMPVPYIAWLAPDRSLQFDKEVAENDAFAAAAMRFQSAAIPSENSHVLCAVIAAGEAPFITSMLHFARSSHIRLLAGDHSHQMLRFIGEDKALNPDFSGIRLVAPADPSHHQLIAAQAALMTDLASFNRMKRQAG